MPSRAPADDLLHEPDARVHHVPEAALQDLWRRLAFDRRDLRTACGQALQILDPGTLNRDGGPDFTASILRIGDTEWYGDVELHRTSGGWLWHRHHEDPAYDRVVLHVALAEDQHTGQLRRSDGSLVPELILLPRLQESLRALIYRFFTRPGQPFACAGLWADVPETVRRPWLRLLGQERVHARMARLAESDPAQGLYRMVLRGLGQPANADAMEALARRVPVARLRALSDPADAEALLLGAAGMLPHPEAIPPGDPATSAYVSALRARWARLSGDGDAWPRLSWQHARLRPANAPARRVAQAAALFGPGGPLHTDPVASLAAAARAEAPVAALTDLFRVAPDPYWKTHLRPELRCRECSACLGRERVRALLLDAAFPALLAHATRLGDVALAERVTELAAVLPAASDRVTRMYQRAGYAPRDALEAQGLHQLYRTRCLRGRCLGCAVGKWALGR